MQQLPDNTPTVSTIFCLGLCAEERSEVLGPTNHLYRTLHLPPPHPPTRSASQDLTGGHPLEMGCCMVILEILKHVSFCVLPSPHPSRWVACSCVGFRQGLKQGEILRPDVCMPRLPLLPEIRRAQRDGGMGGSNMSTSSLPDKHVGWPIAGQPSQSTGLCLPLPGSPSLDT